MKLKAFITLLFSGLAISASAQMLNPITWSFSAKKTADKTYEVHLTASIQSGWHLYSQTQPQDAIAIPTGIKFTPNPLVELNGEVKEMGKMQKFHDEKLGVSANQYSNKVDFVQVVKLKANAKTNIAGGVEFQTCDDKKCLPPKTVNFNIELK